MVIKSARGLYNKENHSIQRHHSLREPVNFNAQLFNSSFLSDFDNYPLDMDVENHFFDVQQECNYWESDFGKMDDVEFGLTNGFGDTYDMAHYDSKVDHMIDETRETRNNSMISRYDMMAYQRWRELDDIMMNDLKAQVSINTLPRSTQRSSRRQHSLGALMIQDRKVQPSNQYASTIDVQVSRGIKNTKPLSFSRTTSDSLKMRWCTGRNSSGQSQNAKLSSLTNPSADSELFNISEEDKSPALPHEIVIKVRNVHPTACLHELHVKRTKLFPKKPIFKTDKYVEAQNKGSFAVICNLEFNGTSLCTRHSGQTKSDARLKAARNMLLKLKSISNLTILLDDEKTLFEHPRCRLLHLHDTNTTLYPKPPTFQSNVCRVPSCLRGKNRSINMVCNFQVRNEKLAAFGTGHNKKQAIVQAARNMLKRLFPLGVNGKDAEKMNTPWKCHFCKKYMTGRKPFLSHLTGRSHLQKMSELQLNVEEQNNKLHAKAEEEFVKREEAKHKSALENCLHELNKELGRSRVEDFCTGQDKMLYKNYRSQVSETSNSSGKSEIEISSSRSSSCDMKVVD